MKKTIILIILLIALITISTIWFRYTLSIPTERELLQQIYKEIKK
jgi:uncharacterized protein YxeA